MVRRVIAILLAAAALCAGAYARAGTVSTAKILTAMTTGLTVTTAASQTNACQAEADKVITAYNRELYDDALEQAKIDLEPGDHINMDALPSEPYLEQVDGLDFIYGWGEQEECACGATVKTAPSVDGKSCKAEVDRESYSCECG